MKSALQRLRDSWSELSSGQAIAAVFLATIVAGLIPTIAIAVHYRLNSSGPSNGKHREDSIAEPIEFDSRIWQPVGFAHSTGDVFRPSMIAREYVCEGTDERLLEFIPRPNSREGVYRRMLRLQVQRDGRWIKHGRAASWDLDGSRSETEYFEGEIHGTQRAWHPNGKLHIERQWAYGNRNGRDRGWYPDGKPMYDAINVDGKELSGKSWDRNGKPHGNAEDSPE